MSGRAPLLWLSGAAIVGLTVLLGGLLASAGQAWLGGALVVAAGFAGAPFLLRGALRDDRRPTWAWLPAGIIVAAAGLAAVAVVRHPLLGTVAGPLDTATHPGAAAGYRFRDAVARPDLRGTGSRRSRYRGRERLVRLQSVVPVVPAAWDSTQPIVFWAVVPLVTPVNAWPAAAGVRVVADGDVLRDAVASATARHGVRAAPDPVFIELLPDPAAALADDWRRLGAVAGGGAVAWLLLVVGITGLRARRGAAGESAGDAAAGSAVAAPAPPPAPAAHPTPPPKPTAPDDTGKRG